MKAFFDENLLLNSVAAADIYHAVKDLPIIDYHCHLDQNKIADNAAFSDIGEMWLSGDHYKWRAMRLTGIDEYYITGDADYKEKFFKFAEIMPQLLGNPLYYWTHLELKQIFGISSPLDKNTAEEIYNEANKKLKNLTVRTLLKQFKVEYIATTDDPTDDLKRHGDYDGITVAPTFRPDKALALDKDYLEKLFSVSGTKNVIGALTDRLDYFASKGCVIADHGFDAFPDGGEREKLFLELAREYKKRGIVMQLHFSVTRNVNTELFSKTGADSGIDVMSSAASPESVVAFLNKLPEKERPAIILYPLNPSELKSLATLSGAFRNVYVGAAWWFNDTVEGIRHNLSVISEYAALGTNLGMLTDSRSFSSYSRFDFFRRILCDFIGEKVEKGEYDKTCAVTLAADICYNNIKRLLSL